MVLPAPCLMQPCALPVWVSGPGLPAGDLRNSVQRWGREEEEWRKAMCRRSTLKRNSMPAPVDICFHRCAHPMWLRLALHTPRATLHWYANTVGAGAWVWDAWSSCVVSGADGTDDESLTERGRSKWRRKHILGLFEKSSRGLFAANNCLEKHNLSRVGLFGAHADYPLLFDS